MRLRQRASVMSSISAISGNPPTALKASRVTNIAVVCVQAHTVGGFLQSLPAGASVTLQNNGADALVLDAVGAFTFATLVPTGASYNVAVQQQPTGHTCTVAQPSGTVQAADVTNVVVSCP